MFCRNCGYKLVDNSKFCPNCGESVDVNTTNTNAPVVANTAIAQNDIPISPIEPPADALVQKSGAPISTKVGWTLWGYIISLVLIALGGVGIATGIVVFIIHYYMMLFHKDKMRKMKFKFNSAITADDIYNELYPAIQQKKPQANFDRDGDVISISFDSIIYDINLHDDATFSIWWRKGWAGAFFSINFFKEYKRIRTGTGLIAYELQKAFNIV